MAIGLTTAEMEHTFQDEYIETSKRRESQQKAIAVDLMDQGMPKRDAHVQAMLEVRFYASSQALLLTIAANNARIQAQLEQKGIKI